MNDLGLWDLFPVIETIWFVVGFLSSITLDLTLGGVHNNVAVQEMLGGHVNPALCFASTERKEVEHCAILFVWHLGFINDVCIVAAELDRLVTLSS